MGVLHAGLCTKELHLSMLKSEWVEMYLCQQGS